MRVIVPGGQQSMSEPEGNNSNKPHQNVSTPQSTSPHRLIPTLKSSPTRAPQPLPQSKGQLPQKSAARTLPTTANLAQQASQSPRTAPVLEATLVHSQGAARAIPSPLPRAGTLKELTPQQLRALDAFIKTMNQQDYFQLLGLPQSASKADIKTAFYRDSRTYHPDRAFHLTQETTKTNINHIYKRITEAYYVLHDDMRREKYIADITGPERSARLRFTDTSEAEKKSEAMKAAEDEYGTVPKARPFFKSALKDIEQGNLTSAERNLRTALVYEPQNKRFQATLLEVRTKIQEQSNNSDEAFKIR